MLLQDEWHCVIEDGGGINLINTRHGNCFFPRASERRVFKKKEV